VDNQIILMIISTSGAVIMGLGGIWFTTEQIGKRIDDVVKRLERLDRPLERMKTSIVRILD